MFSKINSFSTRGIDGYRITVEVDVSNGLPSFVMVGYLAEEVREAQERVRTALRNAGFCLPPKRITVNLSPAGDGPDAEDVEKGLFKPEGALAEGRTAPAG